MTLRDFWKLIDHYKALCIIVPIVFALASMGISYMQSSGTAYTASSHILSAQVSALNGTASSAGREYMASNPSYSVSTKADTASLTISITVSGPDAEGVAAAANSIAASAVENAQVLLGSKDKINAQIEQAYSGTRVSSRSFVLSAFAGLLIGLFVAVCLVMGIDVVARPVKGSFDLSNSSGFPVLGELPGDTGERLLANIRFASGKPDMRTVLVVPVYEGEPAALVGMLIDRAARSESAYDGGIRGSQVRVSACAPLLQGAAAVYEARATDAVAIAASQWKDSRKNVESTANELRLANANVVGCVLVREMKGVKRAKGRVK